MAQSYIPELSSPQISYGYCYFLTFGLIHPRPPSITSANTGRVQTFLALLDICWSASSSCLFFLSIHFCLLPPNETVSVIYTEPFFYNIPWVCCSLDLNWYFSIPLPGKSLFMLQILATMFPFLGSVFWLFLTVSHIPSGPHLTLYSFIDLDPI